MNEKKIPELWSKIRCAALYVGLMLLWIIPCGIKYEQDYLTGPEEETEIIEEITTEPETVSIEPVLAQAVCMPREVSLGVFKLTAYCPCSKCCGKWAGGPTSSGTMPQANHTIAVDPDVIPYGTEVIINGVSYIAEDTGSGINGNCIDIYFESHQDALNFGIQYAEIFIKESN